MNDFKIFALNSSKAFGQKIANKLEIKLSDHEEKLFMDGEAYCSALENVRGKDVFVVQSLYGDNEEAVNSKLMKLLIFIGSLKDASANRIIAVLPFMCYGRQDRKIRPRNPISTKYLAKILESVGTSRILTIDVHNPTSVQNCYNICVDLLEANVLFASHFAKNKDLYNEKLVVMSPDIGGLGRCRKFRKILEKTLGTKISLACLDKIHDDDLIVGNDIMGDVVGKTVLVMDDMISSGKTIHECVKLAIQKGAKKVLTAATHGLFVGNKAGEYLNSPDLEKIIISDTVRPFRVANDPIAKKIEIVDTTDLFARAIKHIHLNESISELLVQQ